ncbi:MAG: ABC transporter ATP-binding protein [Piscirickettsiaceae bacterium CG_4_9_14_3_um_filter_43_564]|nr:ABC transporter ATP-binding protein [Thiomicrospira sp.]OIP96804.1 MAG: ABC transporter ATP-binding protein [Thiomicrospira sp. CG2_30_44_34]PIQ04699.1 MAG: ABC transporter ATP-binding protein [Piscirickettsiaceae bacterium CG18_big_fil_WC_8_21_14_2_50_44_103]PIU39363.1 MAG: ABC transporter ATP-binding protein [Piscirickettsiaceae bacterium CG07_land_8_20_14_0_80_44_28]PIW77800.1 MAG: ABC transporter ATP-binding protein [Piscirickettsiaceae bacterium CG_4_8_14_3_um_filter_44_38]PIX79573.1 M
MSDFNSKDLAKQPAQTPYSWQRIFDLVIRHKSKLIKAHIIALFAMLATVPLPLLLPLLVDEVLLNQPAWIVGTLNQWIPDSWQTALGYIALVTLITILLRVIGVVLGVWQVQQFTLISKAVTYGIRTDLLARIQGVSMSQYETLGSGNVTSTMVSDVNTLDTFLGTTVGKVILAVFSLMGITVVLLWLHWQLALFILLLNPLVVYFTMRMGRKVKTLKKDENTAVAAFQQALAETLDALQQVRAANQDTAFFGRIRESAEQIKLRSEAFTWKSEAASRLSFLIFLIGFDLFRGVSFFMVVFSNLSIGEMMAVFGYLWFMMGPVQEILAIQYAYSAGSGALQRINQVLDLHQEPRYPALKDPFKNAPISVSVKDVYFHYPSDDKPVLHNLNFEIQPGEKLAFVGASGGGKTTLVQILLGFYEADAGQVCYNGVPIEEIGQQQVRQNVATVLQQPMLFQQTVRFNLTLGQDLPEQSLWEALKMAQLDDVVADMEHQLDTMVGRNGVKLSGGQRQRLAIARMILQDPKVVIMDEATSALDMETERKLYLDLAPFLKGRTTLIVAHRLSSIKQADRILVFEDGHIIESGSHEDLVTSGGTYQRLYR